MLIRTITASPWQSNCYLIVSDEGADTCIVVDPGITAGPLVTAELEAQGWRPAALFGTHGHIDHVGDAGVLTARYDVPLYLAAPDQHLLADPAAGLDPGNAGALRSLLPGVRLEPVSDVRDLSGPVEMAGLTVTPVAAPGHTAGSTLLRVSAGATEVVFTGDVLFAGTIGRTDMPGGSMNAMRSTLRMIPQAIDPEVALLPGHGGHTTLAVELTSNPYLQADRL